MSHRNSPLSEKAESEKLQTFPVAIGNLSFLNPFIVIKLILFYRRERIDTVIFSASQDLKSGSISAKIAGVRNIVYLRGMAVPVKASLLNRIIFKSILTHIVANSEETKRNILKYLGKYIHEEKVHVIYHGIDVNKMNSDKSHRLKEIQEKGHGVILGNAGRLIPKKGHDNLLRIARIIKDQQIDFTLFIAGAGEKHAELETLIDELDLKKEVVLLGFVEDMEAFMNSIDIFLVASISEGFGYVLVEAMIKSKPAVAFDITCNPEIVTANETGFLVEYPDFELFAEKTIELIEDENLRKLMGESAMKSVFNRFNLSDRITEFEYYLKEEIMPVRNSGL